MLTTSIGPRIFRYTHVWGMGHHRRTRFASPWYWLFGIFAFEVSYWMLYLALRVVLALVGMVALLATYSLAWALHATGWTASRLIERWVDQHVNRKAHDAT